MSMIQVKNLTFGYDGMLEKLFENDSFNIDTDWKLGLIGRNGKGKTTFLNILQGKLEYTGTITKSVELDYFPIEVKDENKMAIEIVQDIAINAQDWEIIKEINLLNTNPEILYREFKLLSGGEKIKILLIALFLKENNFLLIDEPTNHLDNETKENLINYLRKKKGFIVVSHDRNFLDSVVDHIIAINNSGIEIQKGNFSTWKENKDRQNNFELMQNEKLKKDINRLNEAAKDTANWSDKVEKTKYGTTNSGSKVDRGYIGHQAAKMMKRSKAIENRIEKEISDKSKLLKDIDRNDSLTIKPLEAKKNPIIVFNNLQIKYGGKAIFEKVNMEVNNGDRIAIVGKNGAGKSSILKLILGDKIDYNGTFNKINDLKISYVSQQTNNLKGKLKEFAKSNNVDESIFNAMLVKMGFSRENLNKNIEELSEGQKKKVLIAKSITEQADVYIWDEPLNYIDILTKIQIEEAILKYKPTLIFVEHDETFVKNVATKIVSIGTGIFDNF